MNRMLKKMFVILLILFVMIPDVYAAVINYTPIVNGDISYGIEKVELNCSGEYIMGLTNDNYYILGIHGINFLQKTNGTSCIEMTTEEVLEYYNNLYPLSADGYHFVENDYLNGKVNIYINKFYKGETYILASGKEAVEGTYYCQLVNGMIEGSTCKTYSTGEIVEENRYEKVLYKFPDSTTVDPNITYLKTNTWTSEIVDYDIVKKDVEGDLDDLENYPVNPNNILNYRVLIENESNTQELVKTVTYDISKFTSNTDIYAHGGGVYNKFTGEVLLHYFNNKTNQNEYYDLEGNIVTTNQYISPITPTINIATNINYENNVFIDNKLNQLIKDEKISYFIPHKYENYVSYGELLDNESKRYGYRLYEYRILSDKEIDYDKNDVKYRLTASKNRIKAVYINNTQLDAKDYLLETENTLARILPVGNSILTIKKSYLDTLTNDNYNLKIEYQDGAINNAIINITNSTVTDTQNNPPFQEEVPDTLDDVHVSIIISIVSLIGIIVSIFYLIKNKKKNKKEENVI